jgi:hypothetical protein
MSCIQCQKGLVCGDPSGLGSVQRPWCAGDSGRAAFSTAGGGDGLSEGLATVSNEGTPAGWLGTCT